MYTVTANCRYIKTYNDGFSDEVALDCDFCCGGNNGLLTLLNKYNDTSNSDDSDGDGDNCEVIDIEVDVWRVLCAIKEWLSVGRVVGKVRLLFMQ